MEGIERSRVERSTTRYKIIYVLLVLLIVFVMVGADIYKNRATSINACDPVTTVEDHSLTMLRSELATGSTQDAVGSDTTQDYMQAEVSPTRVYNDVDPAGVNYEICEPPTTPSP